MPLLVMVPDAVRAPVADPVGSAVTDPVRVPVPELVPLNVTRGLKDREPVEPVDPLVPVPVKETV